MSHVAKKQKQTPYRPCGSCSSGYRITIRNGERFATRCSCWKYRHYVTPAVDFKTRAAGQ